MGGIIDGMPAGIGINLDEVQRMVDRRRPGLTRGSSTRQEKDRVEVLSGIFEGKTLGTPIGFVVRNEDCRSEDYDHLRDVYRPSHADYTWQMKYGIRDHRGGGRASARETLSRVVAGAFAMQALRLLGIDIIATPRQTDDELEQARAQGDTLGGAISCTITGVPAGLGEPVFGKLSSALAAAMMSIPAAKSFDMGAGRALTTMRGSESLDTMRMVDGRVHFDHNYSGGVQGGISNGNDIYFEVGFKPIATLMRDIPAMDSQGRAVTIHPRGRHDVSAVPRAVPVVQAMAAHVILDHYLLNKTTHL
jgi:chorismate synthase